MAPGAAPGGGGNIKVVVRVRPFNGRGAFLCEPPKDVASGVLMRLRILGTRWLTLLQKLIVGRNVLLR